MTTNEPKFLSHPGAARTATGPKAGTVGASDLPTTSDDVLLQRVAAGNRLAMQVLYARHHVRVYRFALRLTGNPATAEDLTSDVFLDVWRQAGRFEGRSAVSTWLLAITRLKAFSMMRRRTEAELDDYTAAAIEDPADDPEVALERKDRSAIVRRCLTELSAEHREMIDLVYYHQKSTQEVADIVGIPVNTVKTRTHYARKKLWALLQAAGIAGVAA
jgi:RNA polymerase sigma-70 factor (ECF subfamily)